MRKISLQWRLTILTTVLITVLCGCLTFFLYKNGVYYFNTLQETVTDQNGTPDAIYIDIPDDEWDDFAAQFSMKVYHSKSAYRNQSLLITALVALFGGARDVFCQRPGTEAAQRILRNRRKSSGTESDGLYDRRK